VLYTDAQRAPLEIEQEVHAEFVTQDQLLAHADFISLHVPLLPQTHHLLGDAQFAQMKRTAFVINTSRGPVVDEAALVRALETRRIAGAAIDVYEREPRVHPGLVGRDDVVLAPHIASASVETRTKMAHIAAENCIALFTQRTPPNALNPEVLVEIA
jgi:lactate dehydrogenase-like 2-hydroxyacid dehydrogenase